jgi:hypothetical protein
MGTNQLMFGVMVDVINIVRKHADGIASIDLFVIPTFSFRLVYGLLNAEFVARLLTEALGWDSRRSS